MKTTITAALFALMLSTSCVSTKILEITSSEPDAKIFANGQEAGTGVAKIKLKPWTKTNLIVEKFGYFTETRVYYNDPDHPKLTAGDRVTLIKNDAHWASAASDLANKDMDLKTSMTEDKAWKLISEVVTAFFDVLDVSDKSSGYMRTAWVVSSFQRQTVRTRVIIKSSSSDGLKYKIKIMSESVDKPNVSVKDDEQFKPWHRLLKKYDDMVPELQTRLQ